MNYETVSAEVRRLSYDLRGADDATVAAEQARLRALADQIEDEVSRRSARARVDALPIRLAGPKLGTSPEYAEATSLAGRAHGLTSLSGPAEQQLAEAHRIRTRIGELAHQAPAAEQMTILRMNSSVARVIAHLESGGR